MLCSLEPNKEKIVYYVIIIFCIFLCCIFLVIMAKTNQLQFD